MTTEQTQPDVYQPTPGERKLLDIILNPDHRYLTVVKICEKAGVGRSTYYDIFQKADFVAYYKKRCFDLVDQDIAASVHALAKGAKGGSFQHIKLMLEMGDMHTDKLDVDVKSRLAIFETDDPKKAAQLYAEMLKETE